MTLMTIMIPVESAALKRIGYDGGSLWVEIHDGSLYEFLDVPEALYREFRHSDTKRAFLDRYIRGHYGERRIR